MKRAKIALSSNVDDGMISVRDTYLNSIWNAGGIPTLLPPVAEREFVSRVADEFEGFIFV